MTPTDYTESLRQNADMRLQGLRRSQAFNRTCAYSLLVVAAVVGLVYFITTYL